MLLIEDELLVAMLLEDQLADLGCEVAGIASRLPDAMQKVTSLPFDVAILDVNLNGQRTLPVANPWSLAASHSCSQPAMMRRAFPYRWKDTILHKPFQQHDLAHALRAALSVKA